MTKRRVYFDTSALVKEFVPEVGSDLIDKITTRAREGKLQIVSSIWSINEAIGVIDRLERKEELTKPKIQTIIATLAERITDSSEKAAFFFAPIAHEIVANSRLLIKDLHISPDDALHIYTAWVYDCEYFLIHDKTIINRISKIAEGMSIIDLSNETDRMYVAANLGLSVFEP